MRLWLVASVIWVVAMSVYWVSGGKFRRFPDYTMADYEMMVTCNAFSHYSRYGEVPTYLETPSAYDLSPTRRKFSIARYHSFRAEIGEEKAEEIDAAVALLAQSATEKLEYQDAINVRSKKVAEARKSRLFYFPLSIFLPPIGFLLGLVIIPWIVSGFKRSGNPTGP